MRRELAFALLWASLGASGATPAAFAERCIPSPPHRAQAARRGSGSGGAAVPTDAAGIFSRRAFPAGRITRLGATRDLHHDLLAATLVADPENGHVRSSDTTVSLLLSRGVESSATFRSLVDAIDAVSVIVYIEPAVKLPGGRDGELLHVVTGSAYMPMLRVRVRTGLADAHKIAVIAHELQHVLEAIQGGGLVSAQAMTAVFAKLDRHQTRGGDPFETDAACQVEARVAVEFRKAAKASTARQPSSAGRQEIENP